ncbi:hypothetical protein O181_116421 [Austropuccinia psidii MF-1]|uniref:Uncharacterized protein n=1 Tax=Austropuccinia psidii MF-1 TaxID=1389203 RepID=A0A9Q3K9Z3_9BASI|nr:hypothetical protein [Austropuccinia psidii MF-1]
MRRFYYVSFKDAEAHSICQTFPSSVTRQRPRPVPYCSSYRWPSHPPSNQTCPKAHPCYIGTCVGRAASSSLLDRSPSFLPGMITAHLTCLSRKHATAHML